MNSLPHALYKHNYQIIFEQICWKTVLASLLFFFCLRLPVWRLWAGKEAIGSDRLCLWLLTPKLFSHTPDHLCVATSGCIPCNQRKIFEISFSFSTLSFSSNYLQTRFIFLIPPNQTKNKQKNPTMGSDVFFFFLFEIAGFCATLLPISCLFASFWANMSGHSYPSITCSGLWCILCSGRCSAASVLPGFGFWALR